MACRSMPETVTHVPGLICHLCSESAPEKDLDNNFDADAKRTTCLLLDADSSDDVSVGGTGARVEGRASLAGAHVHDTPNLAVEKDDAI